MTPQLIDQTGNPLSPSNNSEPKKSFWCVFRENIGIVQWFCTIALALVVFYVSQRDLQTLQAQDLKEAKQSIIEIKAEVKNNRADREQDMDALSKKVLTREVFDAYHSADSERMARMEKMMEQILMNQTSRYTSPTYNPPQ